MNKEEAIVDDSLQSPQYRSAEKTTTKQFLSYLRESIRALHTQDYLKSLPIVTSVRIDEPFYVKVAKPVLPRFDLSLPKTLGHK